MHAYLMALEIEPVEANKVYVALPLHCTVVHWFYSEQSPAEVVKLMTDIAAQTAPITLVSGPEALFGKERDVPVNQLEADTPIRELHAKLHQAIQGLGITDVAPQWSGVGFEPHVTRQRSGRFEQGRRFVARKLYLCEALAPEILQQKLVVTKLPLGGTS